MAVQTEPSNDDTFEMWKEQPEEPFIIRKDLLWIILIFLKPLSKTYEAIELFMLMLMSTSNKLCGAWMNIQGWLQGRNLLGGQMWIIFVLLLCGMAPSAACSADSRSPNDSVLDADYVKQAQFEGSKLCNFSHQGYQHVCEDAFHYITCEIIDLIGNRLSSLPPTVFQNVVNLREVFLDGNKFVEMPELINDNLMFLSINNNTFVKFPNQSTIGLPNLTTLSVENCRNLSAIDEAAFENNLKLERVRFSGTPLQKLPSPCSNCYNLTLEGPDTVHLMCGSGPDIVTFESERAENFFLNETVEMLSQTNDSITNRLICITQAISETHSTTHTSPTPTSATPTSATPTAVPKSATLTSAFLIIGVVLVPVLFILVMVWFCRKVIQPWCQKRSGIPNQNFEMVPKYEP